MESSIRKIIAGENITNSIRYVKGVSYRLGKNEYSLSAILPTEADPDSFDLYVTDGKGQFLWKTIFSKMILEKEYDLNFQ
jgi:hypothetical protein